MFYLLDEVVPEGWIVMGLVLAAFEVVYTLSSWVFRVYVSGLYETLMWNPTAGISGEYRTDKASDSWEIFTNLEPLLPRGSCEGIFCRRLFGRSLVSCGSGGGSRFCKAHGLSIFLAVRLWTLGRWEGGSYLSRCVLSLVLGWVWESGSIL